MADYTATRARVADYFDRSATEVWARLTSDAPVSGIRATVRAGRDQMRALMLDQLPRDLTGARVLDAGCGTGAMAVELARRGAQVVAVDIAPELIAIAKERAPRGLSIDWHAGDMLDPALGRFDHILAMDSMIYYEAPDIARLIARAAPRLSGRFVFTLPPRTALLMAMWRMGRLFPRADRSPLMIPQRGRDVARELDRAGVPGRLRAAGQVSRGFYISAAHVFEGQP